MEACFTKKQQMTEPTWLVALDTEAQAEASHVRPACCATWSYEIQCHAKSPRVGHLWLKSQLLSLLV